MKAEMNWNENEIVCEEVDFSSPTFERLAVALFGQLRVEEGREGVAAFVIRRTLGKLTAPLADEIHVEVDDFVVEPIQSAKCLDVFAVDVGVESLRQHLILVCPQRSFNALFLLFAQFYINKTKIRILLFFKILKKYIFCNNPI